MHLLLQVRCNESAKIPHVRKGVDAQDLNISKNLRKKKKRGVNNINVGILDLTLRLALLGRVSNYCLFRSPCDRI